MAGRTEWSGLVTLDMNPDHKPNVVWNLTQRPLPFEDNTFDEIHAYEVCEHLGQQGDWRSFFEEWSEWYRLLKPGGRFFGTSPHWQSPWAFGDPGHTRVITSECFVFLCQPQYEAQVGKTPMTDYRFCFKGDFDLIHTRVNAAQQIEYVLEAIKPSRYKAPHEPAPSLDFPAGLHRPTAHEHHAVDPDQHAGADRQGLQSHPG